jgi:hypothetical protein
MADREEEGAFLLSLELQNTAVRANPRNLNVDKLRRGIKWGFTTL